MLFIGMFGVVWQGLLFEDDDVLLISRVPSDEQAPAAYLGLTPHPPQKKEYDVLVCYAEALTTTPAMSNAMPLTATRTPSHLAQSQEMSLSKQHKALVFCHRICLGGKGLCCSPPHPT